MKPKTKFSLAEARALGERLGIRWGEVELKEFHRGLAVELEHGSRDPETDVTHNDPTLTGKIAWAHLKEFPDYYTRLDRLETEADRFWTAQRKRLAARVESAPIGKRPARRLPHARSTPRTASRRQGTRRRQPSSIRQSSESRKPGRTRGTAAI